MKTKLLYILSSSETDTYLESALISIYSARFRMPNANITLLVDDNTNNSFVGKRSELLNYISEKIVISFDNDIDLKIRSRLLKTNMRNHISGDFLYIDCDTLIANSLNDIENCTYDIAAVLDGHTVLEKHPVYEIFAKQSSVYNYPFEKVENYFSGGVMYVRDSEKAYNFFNSWHKNYKLGLKSGINQDEPSLAKTNFDFGNIIHKLPDEWNCQIRLGALYLKDLKILHFWSKKNMPISFLGSKDFLFKLKNEGLIKFQHYIIDYHNTFYKPIGIVTNEDLYFNFSPLYEEVRKYFLEKDGISYYQNGLTFLEKVDNKATQSRLGKFFTLVNRFIFRIEYFLISKLSKFKA
jgi:hypothetical protein